MRTVIAVESILPKGESIPLEKCRQHRSRIVQILNVPQRVRLRSSLAAALLNGLFEHPAGLISIYFARSMRALNLFTAMMISVAKSVCILAP
ncbi:MAG: hypothetical protein KJS98_06440 [Nitrospirae bacterium]|nr:hypothetical protein [Nitrospirota bacterium]MDE3048350.1 hypothetical protein [Nitrospirota bacterium]MDE3218941.1 hypothetical protein [Nitrospirota bacterium]